jgi:predicted DNA-binding protein
MELDKAIMGLVLLIHHTMKAANKHRISITLLPHLNETLTIMAENTGLSKSSLIEAALAKHLNEQLAHDAKALAKLKFEDLPSEDEWTLIQTETL